MFRYYLGVGQIDRAYRYVDSIQWAHDIHEKKNKLHHYPPFGTGSARSGNRHEQRTGTKTKTPPVVVFCYYRALYACFFVTSYFYRRKQKALSDLVFKNLQWANQNALELAEQTENIVKNTAAATDEDNKIVNRLHKFMLTNAFMLKRK